MRNGGLRHKWHLDFLEIFNDLVMRNYLKMCVGLKYIWEEIFIIIQHFNVHHDGTFMLFIATSHGRGLHGGLQGGFQSFLSLVWRFRLNVFLILFFFNHYNSTQRY